MQINITPAPLSGEITLPASKSMAHRLILSAALTSGTSVVFPACHSMDIDATLNAAKALGALVEERENTFYITGIGGKAVCKSPITIDCGESGSTLRFILPIVAALGIPATLTGHGRLPERPMSEMTALLRRHGVFCSADRLPITVTGKLNAGVYEISGAVSSQHLTGLLLAMPLVEGPCKAVLTSALQSADYVEMTCKALSAFSVTVSEKGGCYQTAGCYRAAKQQVEGDWSQACFYLSAAAMGAAFTLHGLQPQSAQGDRRGLEIFKQFGVEAHFNGPALTVKKSAQPAAELRQVDCRNIPDMVPALAAAAMFLNGKTVLTHAERLRFKESDRIQTTVAAVCALGGQAEETADGLIIYGQQPCGGTVSGANDHRIVMAFAMAAACAKGSTVMTDANAVQKSYPAFWADYQSIGGVYHVLNIR